MPRVFIGVGHGGTDGGAVANGLIEKDVNLNMALAMAEILKSNGIEVALSRSKDENDRLGEEIKECNSFTPDIAVEIHNNAGGGDGFEIYHQTNSNKEKSMKLAKAIEKRILELGQNSRGLRTKLNGKTDWFGWLRENNCPSVICEGFFLDNIKDKEIADTLPEQQAFGKAYAMAVLDYFAIKAADKPTSKPPILQSTTKPDDNVAEKADDKATSKPDDKPTEKPIYKVQVGAFANKSNAEKLLKSLKNKGYEGIIK